MSWEQWVLTTGIQIALTVLAVALAVERRLSRLEAKVELIWQLMSKEVKQR